MTTIADLSLLRRVGRASVKVNSAARSAASLLASSTDSGSSRITRSPRLPVMLVKAIASRNPVASFSNLVLAFWSLTRGIGHRA